MKNLVATVSGGRTSMFLAKYIKEHPKYKDFNILFVYANTGKEDERTLEFINRCDKEFNLGVVWIECVVNPEKGKGTGYKIIDFKSASRNGEPFEDVMKKYGLPSKLYRHCTREMKDVPMNKLAKDHFNGEEYVTALGIRADEPHRISKNPKFVYPLAHDIIADEKFIRDWWSRQSFDLDLKDYEGNCDLCFLKSIRKKKTILKYDKFKSKWWADMELKYATDQQPMMDVYRNLTVFDLVKLSQQPFNEAKDLKELRDSQSTLFDDDDIEFNCFCKST